MGQKDLSSINALKLNEYCADLWNLFMFKGEQVLKPENFIDLDSRLIKGINNTNDTVVTQRTRDIVKMATFKRNGKELKIILAIEIQSISDRRMPIRCISYDGLQYDEQLRKIDGRISPVITMVLHLSPSKWKGEQSIHEMYKDYGEDILKWMTDLKINLLDLALIPDRVLQKLHTAMKYVCLFIKHSNEPKKMNELLEKYEEVYNNLENAAVIMINSYTDANIPLNEEKGASSVCLAIQLMKEEAAQKTKQQTMATNIKRFMNVLGLSEEQCMDILEVSKEDRKELSKLIN